MCVDPTVAASPGVLFILLLDSLIVVLFLRWRGSLLRAFAATSPGCLDEHQVLLAESPNVSSDLQNVFISPWTFRPGWNHQPSHQLGVITGRNLMDVQNS